MRNTTKIFFAFVLVLFSALISVDRAHAADLYMTPASGSYSVGDTFKVSLYVDTKNVPINTVEAYLSFPNDLLSVTSVSKANSILNFWVQEPTFSNTAGTVSLSGGLPTPGYTGGYGDVSDIYFMVKKAGSATISFSSGSVRANDGLGTDVLQNGMRANFTFVPKQEVQPVVSPSNANTVSNTTAVAPAAQPLPSNFSVKEITRADLTYPQAKFILSATNLNLKNGKLVKYDISNIDHYSFQIDQNTPELWNDDGTHIYETPVLAPGSHTLIAKAFDLSGNFIGTSTDVIIKPLDVPSVTDYSKEVSLSGNIMIRGTTYPRGQVVVSLQRENETAKTLIVQANPDGEFFFVSDQQNSIGTYTAWVYALDNRGAKSFPGNKITMLVKASTLVQFTNWSTGVLSIVVPIFALLCLLILVALYTWHKFLVLRKRIRKETRNFEKNVHRAFDLLRDDMSEQINMLKKAKSERDLTAEEEKIVKRLKKNLDTAEDFIQKEIESVEKEVK